MLTAERYRQLLAGAQPVDTAEEAEFEREKKGDARRAAARKAVATKRAKYKKWPTRRK